MLSLTTRFGGLIAAAALALGIAGASNAATVAFGALPATAVANPLASSKSGIVVENSANDIASDGTGIGRLGPWAGTPIAVPGVSQVYTSVARGFAEYTFGGTGKLFKTLSFVWGTPDPFNRVVFFRGGVQVDSIDGTLFSTRALNVDMPLTTVSNINGGGFDTVRFSSQGVAFEYANLSVAAIPVPAAGLLLLTALGGVALLRRRKAA